MRIVEVVASKAWRNSKTGVCASIFGACPWTCDAERADWALEVRGYTWRLDNGTVGLGRVPAKTREEAEEVMRAFNARR